MRYARICPWIRTRRCRAPSNGPEAFFVAQFSAGYTTNMFGFDLRQGQVFPTQEEAQKSAKILKARYPLLQVKVYDALSSGITCTKPAGSRPAGFALAYCCSLPWARIRRTAKASRSEIESFDRSRGRRNHLHKYIRICHRQRTALSATDKRRAICCGIELCTRGMSG
jgi:hypothetical protein